MMSKQPPSKPNTWVRLDDGSWGISGLSLVPGETTTVMKKDGSCSYVVVGKIVKVCLGWVVAPVNRKYSAPRADESYESRLNNRIAEEAYEAQMYAREN